MLKPSMQDLMKRVGNRYLLVNLAAQRARDIADQAEENEEQLEDKAVKLALDEIAEGSIVYRPGPRTEPVLIPQNNAIAAAMIDVDSLELDEEDGEAAEELEDEDGRGGELVDSDGFDDEGLDDGDIPEEDE